MLMQSPNDTAVLDFFSQFPAQRYSKGEVILQPESTPVGAYFLKSGHVREYGMSVQGTEVTIHIFNPGAFFPMTWVIGNLPNRYYYETQTECTIHVAPKEATVEFLKAHPEILYSLTGRLLQGLDRLTERLEYLTYGSAQTRISAILVYLSRHFGEKKADNKIHLKERFTHQEIAALTGLTRETASRELEKLQKQQLIRIVDRQIEITSLTQLKALIEGK